MPKVLIVASRNAAPELGKTVLWRSDIERVFAPDPEAGFEVARSQLPNLVLLEATKVEAALDWIHRLRSDDASRTLPVAVLSRSASRPEEERLRRGGFNEVLSGEPDPFAWDARLERLLSVPRRRDVRVPVKFGVWTLVPAEPERHEALAVNVSARGILLETAEPLDVGARLDMTFCLPRQSEELSAVAQVVREAAPCEGRLRYGAEFLILRGDARRRLAAFVEEGVAG
jgi:DNA-binding response OmpR family regulator